MTWNNFFHFLGLRNLCLSLATAGSALVAALGAHPIVPWNHVLLLVLTLVAFDGALAAFRNFFAGDEGSKRGPVLLLALALVASACVLGLFLVVWLGWPLLVLAALGVLGTAVSALGEPHSPVHAGVSGLSQGLVLWITVFYVVSQDGTGESFLRTLAFALPSALFVASTRLAPSSKLLVLALPLASYLALAVLGVTGLFPWTFLFVAVLGPALSVPFWRTMEGSHARGFQTYLIFCLLSCLAWTLGSVLP